MSTSKTLELISREQVEFHNDSTDCWVILDDRKIVDVNKYLESHADIGNKEELIALAGQDITKQLAHFNDLGNEEFIVGYLATELEEKELLTNKDHKVEVKLVNDKKKGKKQTKDGEFDSTTFVEDLPAEEKLSIATDYNNDYEKHHFLDLNKALIPQILFSDFKKDFYVDQIHRPRHYGKGSAPLFGNFLEPISKTAWWVIPIVWYPVVAYHLYVALQNMNQIFALFLFGVGMFVWTLIEYGLHRFLFHFDDWLPESNIAFCLHFLLHGCHHYLPMDPYRLVMPPTLFVILCAPFYKLVFKALPLYWAYAGFAGGLCGYACYDLCHYFLHHSKMPKFLRKLKKYHLEHHYKNYQLGFGVTSWFWDKVFDTYLSNDSPLSPMKYD
ncbi:ceramide very long chain fatty acid hydroxylase Scs7p [Monosporozyma unispora]|nr:fatty acid alpha-hydroxylase [Kazachstania unispora]